MSLITATNFRDYHKKKDTDFPDSLVNLHITNGENEIINIVGESVLESVEALAEKETRTPKEERQLQNFINALCELTMCSLLPVLNEIPSDMGLMIASNTGAKFGEGGFQIASPSQIDKMISQHRDQANRLISKYSTTAGGILPTAVDGDDEL